MYRIPCVKAMIKTLQQLCFLGILGFTTFSIFLGTHHSQHRFTILDMSPEKLIAEIRLVLDL